MTRNQRVNTRVSVRRRELKEKAVAYKGGKCESCGYDKCTAALEFHHRDPNQKDFQVSSGRTISWDRARLELDKCVLLCSNCHREEHYRLGEQKRTADSALVESLRRRRQEVVRMTCTCGAAFDVPFNRAGPLASCSHECASRKKEKADWPDDGRLREMVWEIPVTTIASRLGVSAQAVSKRCRNRSISVPPPGHWSKAGRP